MSVGMTGSLRFERYMEESPGRSARPRGDALLGEAGVEALAARAGGVALLEVVERGLRQCDKLPGQDVVLEGAGDLDAEDEGRRHLTFGLTDRYAICPNRSVQ